MTVIRSPVAVSLTATPDPTGHTLWAGHFSQQTRLDGSAVTLLNGCDSRRSLHAVCAEWERQQPVALHGEEPEGCA